jgi:hypothetical protein
MKPLLLVFISSIAVLSGCAILGVDKCEGPLDANETVVPLRFLNATGTQSLFDAPSRYSRDSVLVRDEQGQVVPQLSGRKDVDVSFGLLERGKDPQVGTSVKRQFILYLSKADQDTIRAEYMLFENDCDRPQFSTLKVYYNNVQVHENSTTIPDLLIRKR